VTFNDEKSEVIDFGIIWSSSPDSLKYQSYFSLPELIEFPTEVPGQNAYAYFYPPSNHVYQASQEEKPPLLLKSHGTSIIAAQFLSYFNSPCQLYILSWEICAYISVHKDHKLTLLVKVSLYFHGILID